MQSRLSFLERRGSPDALPVAYAVSEGTITDVEYPAPRRAEPTRGKDSARSAALPFRLRGAGSRAERKRPLGAGRLADLSAKSRSRRG